MGTATLVNTKIGGSALSNMVTVTLVMENPPDLPTIKHRFYPSSEFMHHYNWSLFIEPKLCRLFAHYFNGCRNAPSCHFHSIIRHNLVFICLLWPFNRQVSYSSIGSSLWALFVSNFLVRSTGRTLAGPALQAEHQNVYIHVNAPFCLIRFWEPSN